MGSSAELTARISSTTLACSVSCDRVCPTKHFFGNWRACVLLIWLAEAELASMNRLLTRVMIRVACTGSMAPTAFMIRVTRVLMMAKSQNDWCSVPRIRNVMLCGPASFLRIDNSTFWSLFSAPRMPACTKPFDRTVARASASVTTPYIRRLWVQSANVSPKRPKTGIDGETPRSIWPRASGKHHVSRLCVRQKQHKPHAISKHGSAKL